MEIVRLSEVVRWKVGMKWMNLERERESCKFLNCKCN